MKPKDKKHLTIEKIYGIGTYWWFEIFDNKIKDKELAERVDSYIRETMTTFEETYSRFKEDSLVTVLNKKRSLPHPSKEFLELLSTGVAFHKESNGVFNFTLGGILSNRGYDSSYSFDSKGRFAVQPQTDLKKAIGIGVKEIKLFGDASIDFGGFGKGYLIDKLAVGLKEQFDLEYFLINGGGDMYVTSEHGEPFDLYLQHPFKEDEYLYSIKLKDKAFCSSSPYKRRWRDLHTGEVYTHILNPEELDDEVATASFTVADTAAAADAYATVATVIGHDLERCKKILEKAKVAYVLVHKDQLSKSDTFPELHE